MIFRLANAKRNIQTSHLRSRTAIVLYRSDGPIFTISQQRAGRSEGGGRMVATIRAEAAASVLLDICASGAPPLRSQPTSRISALHATRSTSTLHYLHEVAL
ncbi:hypothetical protein FRC08_014356 [Ceratobasidium sp. 394]|nr:hypothetical protein FRC08_014356 [Ceratobasidium sp. 394]